jgi:hypothetical protein
MWLDFVKFVLLIDLTYFYETISLSLLRSFVSNSGASTTNVDFRRGNPTRNNKAIFHSDFKAEGAYRRE